MRKKRPYESGEKTTVSFIFFIYTIISMHEYVHKCAMVIWKIITEEFS